MHHALYIEEILLNIFVYCYSRKYRGFPSRRELRYTNRDLAALSRTCRAFKGLALDMIWAELPSLSPLARCLPSVSSVDSEGIYSFRRPLEDTEWETLRSYTSRVRAIPNVYGTSGLAIDCINQLSNPPNPNESFFPKLQELGLYTIDTEVYPFVLLHFTNPQLIDLTLATTSSNETIFHSFERVCPNVRHFQAIESAPNAEIISDLVCDWSNLRTITCNKVVLNPTALFHIASLPSVSSLSFTVNDAVMDHFLGDPTLPFPALGYLCVTSGSLVPLWRMFRRLTLPVINTVKLFLVQVHPTPPDLLSLFTALGEACPHESLNQLWMWMHVDEATTMPDPPPCRLNLHFLRPLTVFHNLQSLSLRVVWGVDLTQSELLSLASSWPRLEKLELSEDGDWTVNSGITPEGFVQLLERCKSLRVLSAILNTQGYTEIPDGHPWRGRTMPRDTFLHLLNSPIAEDAIDALGVFFHVAPYPNFNLTTHWNNRYFPGRRPQAQESVDTYYWRWVKARGIARDLAILRRKLLKSIETHAYSSGFAAE